MNFKGIFIKFKHFQNLEAEHIPVASNLLIKDIILTQLFLF